MKTRKLVTLFCILLASIISITTLFLLNWKASLALTISSLIISLSFTLTLLEKKVRQVVLEINSGNKDHDLLLFHYEEEIHQFFTLLQYKKVDDGYLPTGLGRIQSNKILIVKNPLSLIIEGPESILSILCENLKTPGSSFYCKKKEDLKSSF